MGELSKLYRMGMIYLHASSCPFAAAARASIRLSLLHARILARGWPYRFSLAGFKRERFGAIGLARH